MPNIKFFLVLILLMPFAYSAGEDNWVNISIKLSWNNGTSFTAYKEKEFSCSASDLSVSYGGSTDNWGHTWTPSEIRNISARLNLTKQWRTSTTGYFDSVKLRVYYDIPEPNVTYLYPTPENNTNIGATFRVNVTTANPVVKCIISTNATGVWKNTTMTLNPLNFSNCYYTFGGRDEGFANNTHFWYYVYANNSLNISNTTALRFANVSTTLSTPILNIPPNNTWYGEVNFTFLNYTVKDNESDIMTHYLLVSNDTENLYRRVFFSNKSENITEYLNFSSIPLIPEPQDDMKVLYHFDGLPEYNETSTYVYNHLGNNSYNATASTGANANITFGIDYGYFGGGFKYDGQQDYFLVKINISSPLTISVWAKTEKSNCAGLGVAEGLISGGNEQLNSIFLQGASCGEIQFYGNGSDIASATPAGFDHTKWNHYVGVSNSTGLFIYLNGVLVGNKTTKHIARLWNGFDIGHIKNYGGGYLTGYLDEVAVWNRSLNPTEIYNLYRLKPQMYYWNSSVWENNVSLVSSQTWQLNLSRGCNCTSTFCAVDGSLFCEFHSPIDLSGNTGLSCFNGGYSTWFENVMNIKNIEIINDCQVRFFDRFSVTG